MMRPTGCWRERKVCYIMFCATEEKHTSTKSEERRDIWVVNRGVCLKEKEIQKRKKDCGGCAVGTALVLALVV